MVDGSTKTMMLRASIASVLLLGGSITAAFAASDSAPATTEAQTPAATDAELPRFEPQSETDPAEFAAVDAVEEPVAAAEDIADADAEDLGSGVASWYGARFAGRKTASGEAFDPDEMTAAHRTLPFGSRVRVSRGGKSVIVRINDRGPFHGNRVIDLSEAAADELGLVSAGSGRVTLALLD
jgi:rare lipoprotein A